MVGFADPVGDAGADADGVEADGDGGADVAGAGGGSGVGVADALVAGAGALVAGAIAVADSFAGGVVSLLLLDDLQEVMSKAGVMTTSMSAARRCISGVSVNLVPCGRSGRLKRKSSGRASVADYVSARGKPGCGNSAGS